MSKSKFLLIVDDDPDDIELFKEALSEVEPEVVCISKRDGKEALDFLAAEILSLPDVIFLDLNMPRLNGKQCLAEIKNVERLSSIPVIIYSTTRQKEDEDILKQLGANFFMIKPSTFGEICE